MTPHGAAPPVRPISRVLVLGTGGIGGRHALAIRAMRPEVQFLCVRDEHNAVTSAVQARLFSTLDEALDAEPDAAVIALPPSLHAAAARACVSAALPFYLEKPVAARAEDIADLVDAAAGLTTMCGCQLRFLPALRRVRDELVAQTIGRPVHARLSAGQWLPDWRPGRDYRDSYSARSALGGGVLRDLIHEVDLARFLFGSMALHGVMSTRSGALEIETEDAADLHLMSDTGVPVTVHVDYLDRQGCRGGRILGTRGVLSWHLQRKELWWFDGETRVENSLATPEAFDVPAATSAALSHFLSCVERREQTCQPLVDGVESLSMIDQARKAAGLW